ncbi:hypothetical protein VTK26DRAFT_1059 [Humicola hyalothermophila]
MPSRLRKFRLFARLRERAKATDSNCAQHAESVSPTARPDPGQRRPPQQPSVAVNTNTRATTDSNSIVDVDFATEDAAIDTSKSTPSRLENLPFELRLQVLSHISDLDDLRALILASPVFYQQYYLDRKHVLSRVLISTLGSLLADGYSVRTSATLYSPPRPPPLDAVREFIENHASLRFAPPELVLQGCTLAELLEMAAFHQSLAQPLALKCSAMFLQHLDSALEVGSLSSIEQTRLLRALYRFQLYCNLFGQGPNPGQYPSVAMLDPPETLALFFGPLNPWEVEEIDCIYKLIRNKYNAILVAIQRGSAEDNPGLDDMDRPNTPNERELLREGTALRGLRLFANVLATRDHDELAAAMLQYQVRFRGFEHVLSWAMQHGRRTLYPSETDLAEARKDRVAFAGDTEDGPPLAWVIGWCGRYCNTHGPIIPAELKAWGYVSWDRRRLIKSGGKDAVLRARQGRGGGT